MGRGFYYLNSSISLLRVLIKNICEDAFDNRETEQETIQLSMGKIWPKEQIAYAKRITYAKITYARREIPLN